MATRQRESVRSERLGSEILHVVTCQEDAFGTVGLAAVGLRELVPAEAAGPAVPHQEAPLWVFFAGLEVFMWLL